MLVRLKFLILKLLLINCIFFCSQSIIIGITNEITTNNAFLIKYKGFTLFLSKVHFFTNFKLDNKRREEKRITKNLFKLSSIQKEKKKKKKLSFKKKKEIVGYTSEEDQLFYTGLKLFNNKDYSEAENIFIELLQKYPDTKYKDRVTYYQGKIYFYLKKWDESKLYFEKLINEFNKSKFQDASYYWLSYINYTNGQYNNALKNISIMQDRFRNSKYLLSSYILKSKIYKSLKRYRNAVETLEYVIDNFKSSNRISTAYFYLGKLYKEIPEVRNLEKSAECFNEIIKSYPNSVLCQKAKKELKYLNDNFLKYK